MRFLGISICLLWACGDLSLSEEREVTSEGSDTEGARLRCPSGTHKVGHTCVPDESCGNGTCLANEDCQSCPTDCGECSTTSDGCPTTGYLRLVSVSTTSELVNAVAAALPGDQIRLAPATYSLGSELRVTRSGTTANPIVICGPRTAVVSGRPILPQAASDVTFTGFRRTGGLYGFFQQGGSRVVYEYLEVDHPGQEGIVIHDGPAYDNVVRYNYVHDTGITKTSSGECIYLGNGGTGLEIVDRSWVHHNTLVNCSSEGIDNKEGTRDSRIEFNRITNAGWGRFVGGDAPINLNGNNAQVLDNVIEGAPRYGLQIGPVNTTDMANGNVLRRNTFSGLGSGYAAIWIQAGHTGNLVYCDNTAIGTALGVTCVP
jgi:hypothetical protein